MAETKYIIEKRILDIVLSSFSLILLFPFFLFIAILIKCDDPKGPVIFRQIRVGKDGIPFKMYKFRSMVRNAEELKINLLQVNEVDGPVFKMKNDPRITRVGKFLRKTSIDELPQLINVLKGDMSFVGPRPSIPKEVEKYSNKDRERLKVLPGLTCYWQIGGRNNISFEKWMELDRQYIQDRSIILDIKLILKTIRVLFGTKDAF